MKIKCLKIRNIASIESGDIDFENGLTDRETGHPSALFLITGDTGSGKSVILDCISMALYGTTPRVKGVNGVKNNTYTNNEGEEISVNDIRQYTRIGIHWKDDCYAELTFKGNDGIEYISTFSLGRTKFSNYRDPVWKLLIGNSVEINNRKDEIRERIQKAVGLTFEQFSRMAMLAQGQFATFLTGKKEERERILEQLTATDIFSRYGEAISNIFRRAKDEKELSLKLYEEFLKKILSVEARHVLQSEQHEKTGIVSKLRTETERLRNRIIHIETVLKAEKDITGLESEKASLKAKEDRSEFREQIAIINLWDKTERERKLLADKLDASKRIASDIRTLQELKSEFLELSENLSSRKEEAKLRSVTLDAERDWLEGKEPLRSIFEDSPVTILNIQSYLNILKETELKNKETRDGKAQIENILKEVKVLEKAEKEKEDECEATQKAIREKVDSRDALKPSELRKDTERLMNRKHDLQSLAALLAKEATEKAEAEKAEQDTTETSLLLEELKIVADAALSECSRAENDMKEAEERYMTMHLSIDKNFKELRRKLSTEHTANCPLCGQSVAHLLDEWNNDAYFSRLLSPLEEEKKIMTETYAKAKENSVLADKNKNITAGSLKAKEAELKKRKKSLTKTLVEISDKIKILNLEDSASLGETIEQELNKIETEIAEISEMLVKADEIQKEIDELLKQKEILDKQYLESDRLLQKSVKNLTKKKEAVRNAEARIEELNLESQRISESISDSLKGYADGWQSGPYGVAIRLKKDADEFSERLSGFTKDEQEHETLLKALDTLTSMQEKLNEQLGAIEGGAEGALSCHVKTLKIENLQKKWNDFLIEVSTVISRRADNESKIKEIDSELNAYYLASGTTDTTLRQLLGAAKEVNDARTLQQKHREEISKITALLTEASKSLHENLKALEVEDSSQIEELDKVKLDLASYEKQYGELTQQLGVIKEKLDADEKTRKDSEKQRTELEQKTLRFEKWEKMNKYFGGSRFRTLVQSHILRPLLNNANIYLRQITDHYTLTCSDENEQLSILVLDRYHNNEPRSVTVLSGGERFMISLALSLALSAMNRPDLNVDILFIDEGFGTLDAKSLDMVMRTLRHLPEINGQNGRRVGVISHREELTEQIQTQIQLHRSGEGRSRIVISNA